MSLRIRILLLVLVAVLAPALADLWIVLDDRRARLASAAGTLSALALDIAHELEGRASEAEGALFLLSLAPELKTGDSTACSAFLASALKRLPVFDSLNAYRPDGALHCDPSGRSSNVSDRRYFREALAGSSPVREAVIGRLSAAPVVVVALAARDVQGQVSYVITSSFFVERAAREVRRLQPYENARVRIWDVHGRVLVDVGKAAGAEKLAGRSFPESALFRWAISSPTGATAQLPGVAGVPHVWTVVRPPAEWGGEFPITIGVPLADLTADADRALRDALGFLLLTALAVFAAAYLVAEGGIRRPVGRITDAISRLRAGDLHARIGAPYPRGEIGTLMASIDATAERLEANVERSKALLAATPDPMIIVDAAGCIVEMNTQSENAFGYARSELVGQSIEVLIPTQLRPSHAARRQAYQEKDPEARAMGTGRDLRARRKDGSEFPVDVSLSPFVAPEGRLIIAAVRDITRRRRAEEQQGAERSVLEGISSGRPLAEILETIARNIEALRPGALCSILLLDADGVHVRSGAAPSLPEGFSRAIDGQPIGPRAGSCGTAAYRNEQVIVTDIATDPLWSDYKALALPLGLRACWSTPVRSSQGRVLATFALYYREPSAPGPGDLELIERWTRLTGIAIERERDVEEIRALNADLERRVAERTAALAQSEERLRLLLDSTAEAIYGVDLQGRCTFCNSAFLRLTGYADEHSVLGRNVHELLHHTRADGTPYPAAECHIYRAFREGRPVHVDDEVFWRADGTSFPVEYWSHPKLLAGTVVGAVVTFIDITERRHRAGVAALSEALARVANEAATPEHALLQCFERVCEHGRWQVGRLATFAPGRTGGVPLESHWQVADRMRFAAFIQLCEATEYHAGQGPLVGRVLAEKRSVWIADIAATASGPRLPQALEAGLRSAFAFPVIVGDDVVAFLEFFAELPREPDALLMEATAAIGSQLARIVERGRAAAQTARASAELERANAQLKEINRLKSEFLASMSHELRTPLNAIIGFSEVLKDGLAGELVGEQKQFVGDILDAGTHLLSLINDILDLSKVEAGMLQLELEPVAIEPLLVSTLTVVKERAARERVALALDIEPGLPAILADARKLKQVAYNLASNAVKFTPEGGRVTLAARAVARAQVALDPALAGRLLPAAPGPEERFVEISVRDTGVGMTEADLARLFEPFVQIDSSLARRQQGTGLGLALVRRLVELHGGASAVTSAPGAGSTFTVWIPCRAAAAAPAASAALTASAASAAEAPAPPDAPGVQASAGRRALVIEDDDWAATIIGEQLRAEGFEVLRAATAEEGLVRAAKSLPQLITLDIILPEMDGWEFLRRLRADPALAAIPVVIVSVARDAEHGIALGATRVLQKPFVRDELVRALAGLVPREAGGRRARVLVVDDNPRALELLEVHLAHLPVDVLRAYGGREAVAAARRAAPDLVILDLMMPDMSGFEVVAALKASPETAAIPLLVVTAKDLTPEDRERLNGHVLSIARKSQFDPAELRAEVRRALAGRAG